MAMEFLQEVLLSMKPEDLGLLFLIYDCQHFSESIITKSLNMIIKFSADDQETLLDIYKNLFAGLQNLDLHKVEDLDTQSIHVTHQRLKYMLDQKTQ